MLEIGRVHTHAFCEPSLRALIPSSQQHLRKNGPLTLVMYSALRPFAMPTSHVRVNPLSRTRRCMWYPSYGPTAEVSLRVTPDADVICSNTERERERPVGGTEPWRAGVSG